MANEITLVELTGNTYPVRQALKAMGARWNGRCWSIRSDRAEEAQALISPAVTPAQVAAAQDCKSISEIEQKITSLFEDSVSARREAVVCSSVHKAKGLEWNTVCLIESSFKSKATSGEESNVYYVACTRAKKTLIRAV